MEDIQSHTDDRNAGTTGRESVSFQVDRFFFHLTPYPRIMADSFSGTKLGVALHPR